jgi:hypothetical protein
VRDDKNFYVKKDYKAGQYLRQTVTYLIMVGATGEPPVYLERRGHARFKKVIEKTRSHIPANKARWTTHPAIRSGKYFVDMDIDGLAKDVDEFRTVLSDMIDIVDTIEDASPPPSDPVPRMERIQSVRSQVERGQQNLALLPANPLRGVARDYRPRDDDPIRFVIKDA